MWCGGLLIVIVAFIAGRCIVARQQRYGVRSVTVTQIADDTYLLVPATNSSLISHELKNISDWAIDNNLKLNSTKCYEMVVSLSNKIRPHIPPPLQGLTRVEEMTVLLCPLLPTF